MCVSVCVCARETEIGAREKKGERGRDKKMCACVCTGGDWEGANLSSSSRELHNERARDMNSTGIRDKLLLSDIFTRETKLQVELHGTDTQYFILSIPLYTHSCHWVACDVLHMTLHYGIGNRLLEKPCQKGPSRPLHFTLTLAL